MASFEVGDIVTADKLNAIADVPLVRLVQKAAQALADDTDVALTFSTASTDYDTHGFHSESVNNTRITPSVAGYYRVSGTVFMASSSSIAILNAYVGKNGNTREGFDRRKPAAVAGTQSASVEDIVFMNGTTDYLQLIGRQTSGGSVNTFTGGSFASTFLCEFIRPT